METVQNKPNHDLWDTDEAEQLEAAKLRKTHDEWVNMMLNEVGESKEKEIAKGYVELDKMIADSVLTITSLVGAL